MFSPAYYIFWQRNGALQVVCWLRGERKGKKHKSQALNHTKPDVCRFRSGDELSLS